MISLMELFETKPEIFNHASMKESDFFKEFTYQFGSRSIHFTWDLYQECLSGLRSNKIDFYNPSVTELFMNIHRDNITVQQFLILLYHECGINPYFFISEVAQVPGFYFDEYESFNLDIGKATQIFSFMNGYHSILYNPRQSGASSLLAAIYVYIKMFRPNSSDVLIISQCRDSYSMFNEKIVRIKRMIPTAFHEPYLSSAMSYDTAERKTYLIIEELEFLKEAQISHLIYKLEQKMNVQVIGNSSINRSPSKTLTDLLQANTIQANEAFFYDPKEFFKHPKNMEGQSYQADKISESDMMKYLITIRYDETNIIEPDFLNHMKKVLGPAYEQEIARKMV